MVYSNYFISSSLASNPKAPREYSSHLYSFIPMKQLLIQVRSNEEDFGLLYPPMLRLLATHYPHLCLVEDWIGEEEELSTQAVSSGDQGAVDSDWDLMKNQREFLRNGKICCFLQASFSTFFKVGWVSDLRISTISYVYVSVVVYTSVFSSCS